jgi:ABC-type multidrug transport system fused ATPase/permease subunit
LLWIAIRHLEAGRLQPSELVSLLLYAMLMTRPLAALANVYGSIMSTRGAAERLLEFFGQQPEPINNSQLPLPAIKGQIEFSRVSFAYPGRPPVLADFDLHVVPGETVALTGPNGAGKTTLVHLLMRFIEPDKGAIKLDGIDIGTVDINSLRRQIGLVAQDTLLMNGTIAENIAYAAPGASLEDMKKAARAAHADPFIQELPQGYDTLIGDQGVKLSGGQRQRLSLARTLLKDPPILILDEATAMFDPEGEAGFIDESAEILRRKSVILITHRPASLALADRVVEIQPLN